MFIMKRILYLSIFIFSSLALFSQEMSYICAGAGSKTLTTSITGGTGTITYTWSGPGGVTSGATRVVTAAGTYTWRAVDNNNVPSDSTKWCTAMGTHIIAIEADPTASIQIIAANSCLNTGQIISATGVPSGYRFSWNFGSGAVPTTSTNTAESVSYTTTGTKTITLTVTRDLTGSTNGCSATCVWTKTRTITIGNLTGSSSCG
jgi:hypothetical protein